MLDALVRAFDTVHTAVFTQFVQPAMFALGAADFLDDAYGATEWFLLGLIQIIVLYALLRPLETRFPAERWSDRSGVGADVIYTLLHRLGGFPLVAFALLTPVVEAATISLRGVEFTPFELDAMWPGVTDLPLGAFVLYLLVLDLVDYGLPRAQHQLRWWWALHALHHAQRKMSFWADDRNHLLDDILPDAIKAAIALLIGVEPAQFVGLVIATRVSQSVQHANLRWTFGPLGYLLVSPVFHRVHHAVGAGYEGRRAGCNFAVLFPVWHLLFGTADYGSAILPTGIRDQLPSPQGRARDYGAGFWRQQWLGLRRIVVADV